jgi:hypothetical protein
VGGALFNAYIYGNMAALMSSMNKGDKFDETFNMIQATIKNLRLPDEIRDTAFEYLMTIENTPSMQYELYKFFDILSDPLKK